MLLFLNLYLCFRIYNANSKVENSKNDISLRLLQEKYLTEKDAEIKYDYLKNLSIDQKIKVIETFKDSLSKLSLVLRISSNFCGTCVNNSILDFLEFSEKNPKNKSIIFAYFSTDREKEFFKVKYGHKANAIYLDNDNLFPELDKFHKPYFFVIDNNCKVNYFFAIPDDFTFIKENYFKFLHEKFSKIN